MLLSKEFVGKTVEIEMVEFVTAFPKKYQGKVEKIVNYGENVTMIQLDSNVTLNIRYVKSITVLD